MRERLPSVVHLTEDIPVEEPNKYRYRKRPIIPLISYVKCLLNILVGSRAKSDDNSMDSTTASPMSVAPYDPNVSHKFL